MSGQYPFDSGAAWHVPERLRNFAPRVNTEFLEHPSDVCIGGAWTDEELIGDFAIGSSLHEEFGNFHFASSQTKDR